LKEQEGQAPTEYIDETNSYRSTIRFKRTKEKEGTKEETGEAEEEREL
jgi:hypothetical protein